MKTKSAIAALTSALTLFNTNITQYNQLSTNVEQVHQEVKELLFNKRASTKERFVKLSTLTTYIEELSNAIAGGKFSGKDLKPLLFTDEVIDISFYILKNKYEKVIYKSYTKEFREFSNARSMLKTNLKHFHDECNGDVVISVDGLFLSEDDMGEINLSAKLLEEKILHGS